MLLLLLPVRANKKEYFHVIHRKTTPISTWGSNSNLRNIELYLALRPFSKKKKKKLFLSKYGHSAAQSHWSLFAAATLSSHWCALAFFAMKQINLWHWFPKCSSDFSLDRFWLMQLHCSNIWTQWTSLKITSLTLYLPSSEEQGDSLDEGLSWVWRGEGGRDGRAATSCFWERSIRAHPLELPGSIVSEQNCPSFAIGNSTLAAPRNTLQFLLFSNYAIFFPYRFAHATTVCQQYIFLYSLGKSTL